MPSYAKIMTDALSEGCYDTSFNQEREDRIRAMNDAQLAGTSQFIAPIVQQSHFKLWRNANAAVLSDIDTVLSYRKEQEILRTKEEESVENKFRDLISRQRDKEAVKKRRELETRQSAELQAACEIETWERDRSLSEKKTSMRDQEAADQAKYLFNGAGVGVFLFAIIVIAGLAVAEIEWFYIVAGGSILLLIAAWLIRKGQLVATMEISQTSPEEIARMKKVRAEEIYLKLNLSAKRRRQEIKATKHAAVKHQHDQVQKENSKKAVGMTLLNTEIQDLIVSIGPKDTDNGDPNPGGQEDASQEPIALSQATDEQGADFSLPDGYVGPESPPL